MDIKNGNSLLEERDLNLRLLQILFILLILSHKDVALGKLHLPQLYRKNEKIFKKFHFNKNSKILKKSNFIIFSYQI